MVIELAVALLVDASLLGISSSSSALYILKLYSIYISIKAVKLYFIELLNIVIIFRRTISYNLLFLKVII